MKMNKQIRKNGGVTEVNLTSLVDVSLTLVIIFMVSYPLVMQSGINVATPSLGKAQTQIEETPLKAQISIRENDIVELNGTAIDPAMLPDSLKSILDASTEKMVLISADSSVLHDRVVAVLDIAKQSGAVQLSIIKQNKSPGDAMEEPISKVDITLLVGVALILVIVFMVTSPLMMTPVDMEINLPRAKTVEAKSESNITISYSNDGKLALNEDAIASFPALAAQLKKRVAEHPDRLVVIRADKNVTHNIVLELLGTAKKAGATRIAIATLQRNRDQV